MKKTLAVVTPYFTPHGGGLERYAHEMAAHLNRGTVRVVVITSGERDSKEEMDGLTVYRLKTQWKFSNTPFSFLWFFSIRTILKQERVDIVNIHSPVPGIGDVAALAAGRRKVVLTYHAGSMRKGSFIADLFAGLYEHVALPFLLRRADTIVATSLFVADFLKKYRSKISIVTPGVDTDFFTPGSVVRRTVLFVGGLNRSERHKGLSRALQAVHALKRSKPGLEMVVVGEGDARADYEEQARALGLEVHFTGRLEGEALRERYREARVLLAPTSNDNFPITILEALACGTPVLSTTVGSIPDILEDGKEGYLIDVDNLGMLAPALGALLAKADDMREQARQKSLRYDWRSLSAAYGKIVQKEWRTIIQVSAYFPPHVGGVEKVAAYAAELQSQAGKVVVLTSGGMHPRVTREKQVEVRRLFSIEFAHTPFAPGLLWHLITLPRASVVHVHLTQAWWPECVWMLMPLRRIPYIAHFHLDVDPSGPLGSLFVLYKKIFWGPVLRGADKVIVCSPDQIPLIERCGVRGSSISVVLNVVEEKFFTSGAYTPPQDALRLLYVGRLASQKRVQELIAMIGHLTVPARLTIVGGGEERAMLEKLARDKHLVSVIFAGEKNTDELHSYYRSHDVFVIASQKEGLPLAVLEAMAAGLPVIASDVIGLRELVRDVGILVREPFAESAARALTELWHAPDALEALSVRSKKKAKEYSRGRFFEALNQAYQTV